MAICIRCRDLLSRLWPSLSTTVGGSARLPKIRWKKVVDRAGEWLGTEENSQWLESMKGNLALVATVIKTMTYQVALNPPRDHDPLVDDFHYSKFMMFNSISFLILIPRCLPLWVISGLPLHYRVLTCLLALGMCVSLTTLALTYLYGVGMVTFEFRDLEVVRLSITAWSGVVEIVGLFLLLRIVLLLVAIFTKRITASTTPTFSIAEEQKGEDPIPELLELKMQNEVKSDIC